ncbi:hypothetical protein N480_01290 [Pseudoalteromonas luteoviolacea S2607]|uniref:FkbM family methyltransferase n=1 Tax=Pseudoalteromonas luteoviolacea TaxID=43657 RepID=UPI0007B083BA|nr:FkbM family methyltransferase [Pseudoalteromonas luteoviolacea]KZN39497.1 hypothetical protein N480_01290 [Pseudoalteromonas luteoviolacea S2607]
MDLSNKQFYIYGCSHYGRALTTYLVSEGLEPKAILDRAPKIDSWQGIACEKYHAENVDLSLPVIITILGFGEIDQNLKQDGFSKVMSTLESFEYFPGAIKILNTCGVLWMQPPYDSLVDIERCKQLAPLWADVKSRSLFKQIVEHRTSPTRETYPIPEEYEMYFPTDIPRLYQYDALRILDVGAYDGDTFQGFYERFGDKIANYHALEVSRVNIAAFQKRLSGLPKQPKNITIDRKAVGLPSGDRLRIEENQSATLVHVVKEAEDVAPEELVEGSCLGEQMLACQCNILKMDIEGADFDALLQAREYISAYQPTLALSLYHRPQDLWAIPQFINKCAPDRYDFYIRQEGHWLLETQFYAVPKIN